MELKRTRGSDETSLSKLKTKRWGWDTTDEEEILRRRIRAVEEPMKVVWLEGDSRFFGNYAVESEETKSAYRVEIRSLDETTNSCECPDYQVNRLGTCKHVERVLHFLRSSHPRAFEQAARGGSPLVEVYLDRRGKRPLVKVRWPEDVLPALRRQIGVLFTADGTLLASPEDGVSSLKRVFNHAPSWREKVRISFEVGNLVKRLERLSARKRAREQFVLDVEQGKRTTNVVRHPLYQYQVDGALHLAFTERAMLADDMGLGKTVQAIAACEILRQTQGIERALIVCPASLKGEWEDQLLKFTGERTNIVFGPRAERLKQYREKSFFHILNYEQVRSDFRAINEVMAPDVVILDEAQRIKNWQTKTAQATKRLQSPYAFVLTGTPLENRIDELYSIVQFLDPELFGPLFRFNREFYELDERGRPVRYKNLDEMHRRVQTIMLRRKKEEVEDQLPGRTVNNYFVGMEIEQETRYEEYSAKVARMMQILKTRPFTREERDILQRQLACMRMLCDTTYILDQTLKIAPKIDELGKVLDEITAAGPEAKVIIFSEWQRMLDLVSELLDESGFQYAWHTGSVPQKKRRQEIKRFKEDPNCRFFLSTDSGGLGLNLQAASVVINMDLPWNPARLEQRIARAWRKGQARPVSVINLICENSIEHRMLALMEAKKELATGVLEGEGDLKTMEMPSGPAALLDRLQKVMGIPAPSAQAPRPVAVAETPKEPSEALRQDAVARLSERLLLMEECVSASGRKSLLAVVDRDSQAVAPTLGHLLKQSSGAEGEEMTLEVLDRATYETLQRLIDAGILAVTTKATRRLHCGAGFEEKTSMSRKEEDRRRQEAQQFSQKADRKWKMATVLAAGGFWEEAIAPAKDAIGLGLKSLVCLAGEKVGDGEVLPAAIESALIPAGLLPAEHAGWIAELRGITAAEALPETQAKAILGHTDQVMRGVSQTIQQRALG
jgi:superfamily II DNA/RNA helicase/gluconate kinase